MSTVAIARASTDRNAIQAGVERLFDLIGDPLRRLGSADTVLLKPNMFQLPPGFQTNRDLVAAVAARVAATGATVVVAERTQAIHQLLDDHETAQYARIVSLDDCPLRVTDIPGATSLRVPMAIPDIVLDCDFFIGLPQLRTHASVVYSNAMKNLVGLLPGYTTRIVHMAGVDESTVDLNLLRPQDLVVSDATIAIEGNYPMKGVAREVGLIAAGTNAVAVDAVVGTVAGFDPGEVAYLTDAHQRGLGPISLGEISVVGEAVADVAFTLERAPVEIEVPRPGIHVYADTACPACRRYIAGALRALADELRAWSGEMTVISGPRDSPLPLRGEVVLVGNCLYEQRDHGIYIEGCPPRAIQLAAFRYAMGREVTAHERTQFRVPAHV